MYVHAKWLSESLIMCELLGRTNTLFVIRVPKYHWKFQIMRPAWFSGILSRHCMLGSDPEPSPIGGRWSGKLKPLREILNYTLVKVSQPVWGSCGGSNDGLDMYWEAKWGMYPFSVLPLLNSIFPKNWCPSDRFEGLQILSLMVVSHVPAWYLSSSRTLHLFT